MESSFSHYTNSKVSMQQFEPVYNNLFDAIITPPKLITSGWDYVLESVTKVNGMTTDTLPGIVEQTFKGAKRRFAGALAESTTVDLVIGFNVNVADDLSLISYNGLRKWSDLIWNPRTGAMMLKKDYTGGPMTVFLKNKIGEVLREWVFPTIWPMSALPAIDLDYSDGGAIYSVEMSFAADYWDDIVRG